jgi:hypothetical protein
MALEREWRGRLLEDAEVGVRRGRGGAGVRVGEPRAAVILAGVETRGVGSRLGGDLGTGVWLEDADTKVSLDEVVDAVVGRFSGLLLLGLFDGCAGLAPSIRRGVDLDTAVEPRGWGGVGGLGLGWDDGRVWGEARVGTGLCNASGCSFLTRRLSDLGGGSGRGTRGEPPRSSCDLLAGFLDPMSDLESSVTLLEGGNAKTSLGP